MQQVRIGDLCSYAKGLSIPRDRTNPDKDIAYLHYGDLYKKYDFRLNLDEVWDEIIKIDSNERCKPEQVLNDGDIVFTLTSESVDDLGHSTLIINKNHLPLVSGMETTILHIIDKTRCLPSYLNYVFKSNWFRQVLRQYVTGMKVYRVHPRDLMDIEVPLPDLSRQHEVCNLLNPISDCIDVNTKINDYLGKLAREMFEHEANMYDTVTMSLSKCTLINKGSLSSKTHDQVFHYLDTGNITNNYVKSYQRFRYEELPSRARRLVKEGDVVYSTVRPNQLHFGLLISVPENCVVSTGFAVIRSKDSRISNEIIYLSLTSSNVIEYLQGIAESSTSTYPSITSNDLGNIEVPIISDNIQKTLKLIFKIINSNQCQNRILNDLRERILEFLLKRDSDK